mgnify:FL=1
MIVMIAVCVLLVASAGTFFWALSDRSAGNVPGPGTEDFVDPPPPPGTWDHILWRKKADLEEYRQTMTLKRADDPVAFQSAVEATLERFGETFQLADELIDPIRNEDGSVPEEFSLYLFQLAPLQLRMRDLSRELSFESPIAHRAPAAGSGREGAADE